VRLLIANRGEIAVRIVRAARKLGVETVQVHSAADADMLAVRLADEAVEIGPPPAAKSYLNVGAVLDAARRTGATAVHPGYGFLSENAGFARAVEEAGLVFVGPSPEAIEAMGDKARARQVAEEAGVPVVPGVQGVAPEAMAEAAARIGFPVMIKAAAGGGGRGIRVAEDAASLRGLAGAARAEAQAAFGDGTLYLERLVSPARHVEVQVLGDGTRAVHLFERECSVQRRRQKVWEEAPAPGLPEATRQALCDSAVRLAEAVGYRGAGTVEYLYDGSADAFFFIEMNTRIQVEHPVTEMVTGVDLVAWQLRIARGEPLGLEPVLRGHAVEARINAEDAARGFLPQPGRIEALHLPGGPGIRFDHAMFAGCEVPPFYDSLLGKLVAWGPDREAAMDALAAAAAELCVEGIATTAPLARALARDEEMRRGPVHTGWLEGWLAGPGAEALGADA
jgi:acetyl-CoA carboxylase biotin carboxylase subunit